MKKINAFSFSSFPVSLSNRTGGNNIATETKDHTVVGLHHQLQNGETISANSVSNSGSERGADNKSSGYCSSNLYSSGSVEEPIYSEPLVADIVPRIVSDHVIDVEPVDDDDEDEEEDGLGVVALCSGHKSTSKQQAPLNPSQAPQLRVVGLTNSHSSNYRDKVIIITEESDHVDDNYHRAWDGMATEPKKQVISAHKRLPAPPPPPQPQLHRLPLKIPAPPPLPPTSLPAVRATSPEAGPELRQSQMAIATTTASPSSSSPTNENGVRRSRKLPTIMEGIDGQIPRPIWPCDMDDSLMDINFESFLYSNEKRENGGQQQHRPRTSRRCDSPIYERSSSGGGGRVKSHSNGDIGGAQSNDIENNYRCMKYLNSCSENPYIVEGVEDLQMSVDKSLSLYLTKCDDSLTMQNTRDFLEDIRAKLNGLLEHHAHHSRAQLRASKTEASSLVYHKSVALIERQIEKLKCDLDSYLKLFNQSNEQQIKQLCTGLAKDARIKTLQNAIENRRNSMVSASHETLLPNRFAGLGSKPSANDSFVVEDVTAAHHPDHHLHHLHHEDSTYDMPRGAQQPQNIFNVISQYPENDLSSYFDTVYVQDGFNMGYKVNNHPRRADHNNLDGSVVLRGKSALPVPPSLDSLPLLQPPPFVIHKNNHNHINSARHHYRLDDNSPVLSAAAGASAMAVKQKRAFVNDNSHNYNSIASSADPNFRLKRNPSLSLSTTASHSFSGGADDRHPILASRDYEKLSKHDEALITTATEDDDSCNQDYPDTDSLESHKGRGRRAAKDGQRLQNMIMTTDQGNYRDTHQQDVVAGNLQEARKSIASEDLNQEWHKNRPSIWELYYGINRPKQSMLSKKSGMVAVQPMLSKKGKKKKTAIPYVSISLNN